MHEVSRKYREFPLRPEFRMLEWISSRRLYLTMESAYERSFRDKGGAGAYTSKQ